MVTLPRESWIVLSVAGIGVALLQTARLWWRAAAPRWRLQAQAAHAAAGEARADRLLARAGFRVQARQVVTTWSVDVDGAGRPVTLRADFLVVRGRRRYVAEVKTGIDAPDVASPATRRQLLEYRCAFGVDGVLLVDADADRVHAVSFALPSTPSPPALRTAAAAFAAGVIFGAAVVAAVILRI
jgi:hypothetical protein